MGEVKSGFVKFTAAADWFCVDPKTLFRNCQQAGIRVLQIGPRCRRIRREDFEKIKAEGLTLYGENYKGIRT